jgi:peptidoglycan/xylan/chitin deacetylase (PgdA/CDA1 family)
VTGDKTLRFTGLLYHDVVPHHLASTSGFAGADADEYKLDPEQFKSHLSLLYSQVHRELLGKASDKTEEIPSGAVLLTFDDGGESAITRTADMLESLGIRGYFFITTDCVGKAGFLNTHHVRELSDRGHCIGSHSCSHPPRISALSRQEIVREWRQSCEVLAQITGRACIVGSVPGGYFSWDVADAANEAGLQTLFTSEPIDKVTLHKGLRLVGRYSVKRRTPEEEVLALALGSLMPRYKQRLTWNARKIAKAMFGEAWLSFRRAYYQRTRS